MEFESFEVLPFLCGIDEGKKWETGPRVVCDAAKQIMKFINNIVIWQLSISGTLDISNQLNCKEEDK